MSKASSEDDVSASGGVAAPATDKNVPAPASKIRKQPLRHSGTHVLVFFERGNEYDILPITEKRSMAYHRCSPIYVDYGQLGWFKGTVLMIGTQSELESSVTNCLNMHEKYIEDRDAAAALAKKEAAQKKKNKDRDDAVAN